MTSMDKFCLNWNGYHKDINESFRILRENQRLFDVTLVTDDGQHVQAHKIILSAGSNFFSDIFMKSNHSNMLVYLKGISSDKLELVINFIYSGEVSLAQEHLKMFIETGKELQVKGLEGELIEVDEYTNEKQSFPQQNEQRYDDYEYGKINPGSAEDDNDAVDKMKGKILESGTNNELGLQINEMIEKNEGVWRCKICGKATNKNSNIREHAERHMKGIFSACQNCSKTFTNRPSLKKHISRFHSELFSCNICERTGMKKGAFQKHNKKHHE